MQLLNVQEDLIPQHDGPDVLYRQQELGDDFFRDLDQAKEDFAFRLNGLTSVASIPAAVEDKWILEGFDFWNAPAREIIAKLRADEMTDFIISGDKRF